MREHGTHACYVFGPNPGGDTKNGCRCAECRKAQAAYNQSRKGQLIPAYVGADRAREHIAMLSEHGVGLKQIVKVSGVSQGALWKLMYGKRQPNGTQRPSKRIRRDTEQAILNVTPSDGAQGSRVPAGPVWEQIDALVAAGVPKVRIAERCGQTGPGLQVGREVVTRRTAAAVQAMYDEMQAGTLVTVKRHRHGDRPVTPEADELEPVLHDGDRFIAAMADLLEARNAQDWRRDSACRGRPTWMWFPARGDAPTIAAAKRICSACFVRAECLAANLDARDGIYGGLTGRQRRSIRERAA